ncbi:MAG: lipid kinase, partial [Nostoc sp.]
MNSRALLLVNRHARQGQKGLLEAIQYLKTLGFDLIEESTEDPKHLAEVIFRYQHQVELVI